MTNCIICGKSTDYYSTMYDDRYGYPGTFQLNRCRKCGHKFILGNFTSDLLTKLYTNYYPRSTFDLSQYRPSPEVRGFKSWLNGERRSAYSWIPKGVCVLDIGCGFGETLGYHQSRGCDVYGVEADENIRRVADKFGFKVHVGLFDPNNYEPEFFDYVTLDQVIEHVTDPLKTMLGIAKVLKPGGTVILSTPNANGWGAKIFHKRWINWHAPYHLQHFTKESMKIASEQAGLLVEQIKTITSSEWLYYQWAHILTFPEMGKPSVFWSLGSERGLKEKTILKLLHLIHVIKVNHLLTRLFDAFGVGDNYIFILRKK